MRLCVGFKSQCSARVFMSMVIRAKAVSATNNNYMCAAAGCVFAFFRGIKNVQCLCVCVCVCVSNSDGH